MTESTAPGQVAGTRWLGHSHRHFESLESTNDQALVWARGGAPHGAIVTADHQSAGRGRWGRAWHSPAGSNLYASFVLRPQEAGVELGALGLVVALGLHRGLRARLPGLGVKWPNDLVVQGRKLGGILCESRWQGQRVEVVVGVGINVTTRSWPEDLAGIAVSIGELAAGPWHTDQILVELLPDLESVLDEFIVGGFAPLQAEYERVCVSLGRPATVSDGTGNKVRWACADGIDATGALWVRDESGRRERVCAGELLLLR